MRTILFLGFLTLFFTSCEEEPKITTDTLASYMEGSFSSENQSKLDTTYFHITLDMKKVALKGSDEIWLYVEQTAASTPNKPYRQRFYHLQQVNDSTFTSSIYTMEEPEKYIGGHKNTKLFNDFSSENLAELEGCSIELVYRDGIFKGKTEEGACKNSWGAASYATSEVTIEKDKMMSWDRGWNDEKEQVWGATEGGYVFDKVNLE